MKGRARVSVCELQGAALKALKKDKVRGKAAPVQPAKEVAVEKRLVEAEAELADGVVDEVEYSAVDISVSRRAGVA